MLKVFISLIIAGLLSFAPGISSAENWKTVTEKAISGSIDDQFRLGEYFVEREEFDIAKFWFSQAADQGHAVAQYNLGIIYHYGLHNGYPNSGLALKWLSMAAEQGMKDAQYAIGELYRVGYKIPKDVRLSLYWLLKSAHNGDPDAQNTLAALYYEGDGIKKDVEKAFYWREKAAFSGDLIAQKAIIAHYISGKGVEQNRATAYAWILASNLTSDPNLKKVKQIIEGQLTQSELSQAEINAISIRERISAQNTDQNRER